MENALHKVRLSRFEQERERLHSPLALGSKSEAVSCKDTDIILPTMKQVQGFVAHLDEQTGRMVEDIWRCSQDGPVEMPTRNDLSSLKKDARLGMDYNKPGSSSRYVMDTDDDNEDEEEKIIKSEEEEEDEDYPISEMMEVGKDSSSEEIKEKKERSLSPVPQTSPGKRKAREVFANAASLVRRRIGFGSAKGKEKAEEGVIGDETKVVTEPLSASTRDFRPGGVLLRGNRAANKSTPFQQVTQVKTKLVHVVESVVDATQTVSSTEVTDVVHAEIKYQSGDTKTLPLAHVSPEEVAQLASRVLLDNIRLFFINISCGGTYYTRTTAGDIAGTELESALEKADFLMAAAVWGRSPQLGHLFDGKDAPLIGYRNPILEAVRLLEEDEEYCTVRCCYDDIYVMPTIATQTGDITSLEEPVLSFHFRLITRDLQGQYSYLDLPESIEEVEKLSSKVLLLLRPLLPAINAILCNRVAWIQKEPILAKVDSLARVLQLVSNGNDTGSEQVKNVEYERIDEHASKDQDPNSYFWSTENERDVENGLEYGRSFSSVFTKAMKKDLNNTGLSDTEKALRYMKLGESCTVNAEYQEAVDHYVQAAALFSVCVSPDTARQYSSTLCSLLHCLQQTPPSDKWSKLAKKGQQPVSALIESILPCKESIVARKDKLEGFLCRFRCLVSLQDKDKEDKKDLGSDAFGRRRWLRTKARYAHQQLLIHFSHSLLAYFESCGDLDGVQNVCRAMQVRGSTPLSMAWERRVHFQKEIDASLMEDNEEQQEMLRQAHNVVAEAPTSTTALFASSSSISVEGAEESAEKQMVARLVALHVFEADQCIEGVLQSDEPTTESIWTRSVKALANILTAISLVEAMFSRAFTYKHKLLERAILLGRSARCQQNCRVAVMLLDRVEQTLSKKEGIPTTSLSHQRLMVQLAEIHSNQSEEDYPQVSFAIQARAQKIMASLHDCSQMEREKKTGSDWLLVASTSEQISETHTRQWDYWCENYRCSYLD